MNKKSFIDLRNVLAKLYPDILSIRRIVDDSGFDQPRIDFASNAIDTWHSVLTMAEKTGQISALFDVVKREYGTNEGLRKAYDTYFLSTDQTDLGLNRLSNAEDGTGQQKTIIPERKEEESSSHPAQTKDDSKRFLDKPIPQSRDAANISPSETLTLASSSADQEGAVASLPPTSYQGWQQVLKKIIGQGRRKWVGGLSPLLIAVIIWLLNTPVTQERLQSLMGALASPTLAATPKSVSLAEKTPTSPPTSTRTVAPTTAQTATPIATPTDDTRPTAELFEDSSLSFVPANDDEVLIVIANFRDESEIINYDIASRIEDAILEKIPTENIPHLRIERLDQAFKGNERELAQRIAKAYGASVFIWGHYDDGGAFSRIEVLEFDSVTPLSRLITRFPAASLSSSHLGQIGDLPLQNLTKSSSDAFITFVNYDLPATITLISQFSIAQSLIKRESYSEAIQVLSVMIDQNEELQQKFDKSLIPYLYIYRGAVHMAAVLELITPMQASIWAADDFSSYLRAFQAFQALDADLKQQVIAHYHSAILDAESAISEISDGDNDKLVARLNRIDFLFRGTQWGIACDQNEILLSTYLFLGTPITGTLLANLASVPHAMTVYSDRLKFEFDDADATQLTATLVLLVFAAMSKERGLELLASPVPGLLGLDFAILLIGANEKITQYLQESPPVPVLPFLLLSIEDIANQVFDIYTESRIGGEGAGHSLSTPVLACKSTVGTNEVIHAARWTDQGFMCGNAMCIGCTLTLFPMGSNITNLALALPANSYATNLEAFTIPSTAAILLLYDKAATNMPLDSNTLEFIQGYLPAVDKRHPSLFAPNQKSLVSNTEALSQSDLSTLIEMSNIALLHEMRDIDVFTNIPDDQPLLKLLGGGFTALVEYHDQTRNDSNEYTCSYHSQDYYYRKFLANAYYVRGVSFQKLKQDEKALIDFKRYLELETDSPRQEIVDWVDAYTVPTPAP